MTCNLVPLPSDRAAQLSAARAGSVLAPLLYGILPVTLFTPHKDLAVYPGLRSLEHRTSLLVRAKLQGKYLYIKHNCLKD